MEDLINKELEEYQNQLAIRSLKLKPIFKFNKNDIDEILATLSEKQEITL